METMHAAYESDLWASFSSHLLPGHLGTPAGLFYGVGPCCCPGGTIRILPHGEGARISPSFADGDGARRARTAVFLSSSLSPPGGVFSRRRKHPCHHDRPTVFGA